MNYIYKKEYEQPNTLLIQKTNYIVVFALIYFSSSFVGLSMSGSLNASILFVVALIGMLNSNKTKKISGNVFLFFCTIIIFTMLTYLIHGGKIYNYMIFYVYFFVGYLTVVSISVKEFIIIYTKTMYFISIFSLVTYALLLIAPSLFQIFPLVTNGAGLTVNNLFFAVVRDSNYFNSNFGLFWEPGAYQTFLGLALFFELFLLENIKVKRVTILLLTIATTFSTTGYIATLLILLIFIFSKAKKRFNQSTGRTKLIFTIMTFLVLGVFVFFNLPDIIVFKVFGKLESIWNPALKDNISYESTAARMFAIEIPIISFFENPLFGIGFENLSESANINGDGFLTATPLNWFGAFGIFVGILMNLGIWKWATLARQNLILTVSIFTFLNLLIFSQNYNRNAFILALLLYGIELFDNRKE